MMICRAASRTASSAEEGSRTMMRPGLPWSSTPETSTLFIKVSSMSWAPPSPASAWAGAAAHPVALRSERNQQLGGLRSGGAEPVRGAGIELGSLARLQNQVERTKPQPQVPGEQVHPLVAFVALLVAVTLGRWDEHLIGPQTARSPGQRDERAAVTSHGPSADTRIARLGHADEFVEH